MMWLFIMLFMLLAGLGGFVFVIRRMTRFGVFQKMRRRAAYLTGFCLLGLVLVGVTLWSSIFNTMIVFIHLLLIWLLCDGCAALVNKVRKQAPLRYWAGYAAIAITVCYLAVGYFYAHHVYRTAYTIETEQELGVPSLRIVGFSDSHVGTTFHGDKFPEYVARMNAEEPDLVVIAGDFVDDDTSYADMVESCRALAELKTKYGVYFIFGNHDSGYYGREHRGYDRQELIQNLRENNVIVLEDAVVPIVGNVELVGRLDASFSGRAPIAKLAAEDRFSVVLDHQPNDYTAEAAANVNLVISGHTHGGQFFPINRAGEWIGANDMTYGSAQRGITHFLISSGISNWAFQFKTGCISEYFVVDVVGGNG